MKSNQRIIRLIAAILVVVSMLTSLSSCVIDFGFYSDLFGSSNSQEEGEQPGGDGGQNNNGSLNGGIVDDRPAEFYPGSGEGDTENLSALRQTMLSTVSVISTFKAYPGAGSGVIYSIDKEKGDAYIITNQHVVYDEEYGLATTINVFLYGMELSSYAIPAKFIGGSVTFDIAVLKVEGSEVLKNSYAKAAPIASSDNVRVFDTVYAVGNPAGYGLAATKGIVSVESENVDISGADGSEISLRVIRIDAAVNGGNSGGGLYDVEGRLVGIVCAKSVGTNIDNIGYAIPSDLVRNIVENLLYHCDGSRVTKLNRALMGITITAYVTGLVPDGSGDLKEVELVEVVEVANGSLAAGKVMVGDIVNSITVDGVTKPVTKIHHVTDHMLNARVGSTVSMEITRGTEKITISFTITADRTSLVN